MLWTASLCSRASTRDFSNCSTASYQSVLHDRQTCESLLRPDGSSPHCFMFTLYFLSSEAINTHTWSFYWPFSRWTWISQLPLDNNRCWRVFNGPDAPPLTQPRVSTYWRINGQVFTGCPAQSAAQTTVSMYWRYWSYTATQVQFLLITTRVICHLLSRKTVPIWKQGK